MMKQGAPTASEIPEEEVVRAAMRIALESLAGLEWSSSCSDHDDTEVMRKYISMCPFVPENSPAMAAALRGLDEAAGEGSDAGDMSPRNSSPPPNFASLPKPPSARRLRRRFFRFPTIPQWILTTLKFLLLETPMMLLLISYFAMCWTHHVHDEYWSKHLDALEWTNDRHHDETTYYRRTCSNAKDALSTDNPAELFLAANATSQEAYDHQLKHGMTIFRKVLSDDVATNLRNFVVKKNHNMEDHESIFVIANKNRYSFGLGTEEPSVTAAMMELANHEQLKSSLEHILGPDPALIEMTAITSTEGAKPQWWHDDVVARASPIRFARNFGPSYSLFIMLQNTTRSMGATTGCPGTHFCADGPMDDWCDTHGFQLVNEDDVWGSGDCMLMNMNIWHRGAAHTGGDDRVMLILTFVPKPRSSAETRQMSQGITFSLRWDMWGHTLEDLAQADTRMRQPWATLRALGLYKPKDASWGIDWITGSCHRLASSDNGYNDAALEKVLDAGGFYYVPKFLHYDLPDSEGWHEYYYYTLLNCEAFMKELVIGLWTGYVALHVLGLLGHLWRRWRGRTPPANPFKPRPRPLRSFGYTFLRLGIMAGISYGLYAWGLYHVDHTEWAREIRANRLHSNPFGFKEEDLYSGPTTLPHRMDVLFETRYKSEYLRMYNDFVNAHPGNRVFMESIRALGPLYQGYDETFKDATTEWIHSQTDGRFLYQNAGGHWIVLQDRDALEQIDKELRQHSDRLTYWMVRHTDYAVNELRYGKLRSTAMGQVDSFEFLQDLKSKLLGRDASERPAHNLIADPYEPSTQLLVVPHQRPLSLHSPLQPYQSKAPLFVSSRLGSSNPPESPKTEPRRGAWIKEGDLVEGRIKEKGKVFWYECRVLHISSSAFVHVRFDMDGEERRLRPSFLRRYKKAKEGEKVEYWDGTQYLAGKITKVRRGGVYTVRVVDKHTGWGTNYNVDRNKVRRA